MTSIEPPPAAAKRKRRWYQYRLRTLLVLVLVVIPCSWLAVAIHQAKEAAIACASQSHLNQLQLVLNNYESLHGHFPPAYIADKDGKPIHSWRVLVLPFIGEESLYKTYDFSEPWNGPHNSKLADKMPGIFHMPSEPPSTSVTNVVAITGPGTAFPGSRSTRKVEFTDGLDNTILLAEIADSNINWLEPRDLQVEEMSFAVNDKRKPSISSSRRRGPYVVFGDSIHAHRVSPSLRPEVLRALTTIAGGEKMYMAEMADVGLTSPAPGPATDEKLKQLDHDGLWRLWLSRSDVTDDALRHLAAAPGLSELHLRSTRISDDGLRYFQRGASLRTLDLSYTGISNSGLHHLAGLTGQNRVDVYLEGTRVTMLGVAQFLKSLPEPKFPPETWIHIKEGSVSQEVMHFGDSSVTDADIVCFQGLSTLRQVNLNQTQITNACLKHVAAFTNLVYLEVPGTRISDEGLEYLKGLTKLQGLNLSHTEVTDEGVKKLQRALPNCKIDWEPPTKDERQSRATPDQPGG